MKIIGLTGSIAMGKSTVSHMLRRLAVPVHDADATVHNLMGPKGAALSAIKAAFPGVVGESGVDRSALGRLVFGQPQHLRRLEAILHPMVRQAEGRFLARHRRSHTPLVVLDIPLLYETAGQKRCDGVMVVWCSPMLQAQRALRRPGMDRQKLQAIRYQQMPIHEKKRRADWVIPSGWGKAVTCRAVKRVLHMLKDQ